MIRNIFVALFLFGICCGDLAVMAVVGCASNTAAVVKEEPSRLTVDRAGEIGYGRPIYIVTDKESQCKYMVVEFGTGGAICPMR